MRGPYKKRKWSDICWFIVEVFMLYTGSKPDTFNDGINAAQEIKLNSLNVSYYDQSD